jgi:hypothetical protein
VHRPLEERAVCAAVDSHEGPSRRVDRSTVVARTDDPHGRKRVKPRRYAVRPRPARWMCGAAPLAAAGLRSGMTTIVLRVGLIGGDHSDLPYEPPDRADEDDVVACSADRGSPYPDVYPIQAALAARSRIKRPSGDSRCCGAWTSSPREPRRCGCCRASPRATSFSSKAPRSSPSPCSPRL